MITDGLATAVPAFRWLALVQLVKAPCQLPPEQHTIQQKRTVDVKATNVHQLRREAYRIYRARTLL